MDYKYRLQCINEEEGVVITHEFSADISSHNMYYRLREFLLGTSWQPETVDEIVGKEE